MKQKETILVFAAHSDDEIIGCGATIAKFSEEGKEIITVVFSSGEKSSPWLKKNFLVESRKEEAKAIGRFIGSSETIFMNLKDTKLMSEIENPKVDNILKKILKRYNPSKIFVHSKFDPHEDHRAVNKAVFCAINDVDKKQEIGVYVFEVWNVLNETHPRIYIDVSKTFKRKIEAMKKFKSQRVYIYTLLIPVWIRAVVSGFHAKCRFAERFYKVR